MERSKVGWVICERPYREDKSRVVSGTLVTQSGVRHMLNIFRSQGRVVWAAAAGDRTHTEVVFNSKGETDVAGNRVYVVEVNIDKLAGMAVEDGAQPRVLKRYVRASNPAAAERRVYGDAISARYAEQDDLIGVEKSAILETA